MKRLLSIALCLILLSTLFYGCAKEETTGKDSSSSAAVTTQEASTTQPASPENSEKIVITTTLNFDEISEQEVAEFNKLYPNITLKNAGADDNKVMTMIASGNGPDIIRVNGLMDVPTYVSRHLALPLDSMLEKSEVFPSADMMPAQQLFRSDGKSAGVGPVYGFVKDWGVDTQLFINKKVFQDAGVALPPTDRPMSYDELFTTCKAITKLDGDKIISWGFGSWVEPYVQIMVMLAQQNLSLWSDDFNETTFTSPETMKAMQYWIDFAKAGACGSAIHPLPDGYGGNMFMEDKLGVTMEGYWFTGSLRSNPAVKERLDDFVMLPSPVLDPSKPAGYSLGVTGAIVFSGTKNPDAAFKFMEFYFAGLPALNRAKTGWGLPIFKSRMNLLPDITNFDKQTFESTTKELEITKSNIRINPYVSRAAINSVFDKYYTPVLFDKMTLADAAKKMDEDIKVLVSEGKDILGIN